LPFRRILHELVHSTAGAVGAIFLDSEGETVQLVSADSLAPDDLRFVGAWQGIFLAHLRNVCNELEAGPPRRFKIEFARAAVLSCDLKDGYYVVLLIKPATNEGLAWHRLHECRDALLAEM
jgi:predicted regulator of Ras-like GTPase activity (Roadblock/LC7/MglB family)